MTETEKLLLDTLKTLSTEQEEARKNMLNALESLENEREQAQKNMLNSLAQLAIRVQALEGLSKQVAQLSEQNTVLSEQLRQLTSLSKR